MNPRHAEHDVTRRPFGPSLRALLRTASVGCMLSAIPGFWPAVIMFATLTAVFLLPGAGILTGLVLVQLAVYWASRRLRGLAIASSPDDSCYQVQTIDRR